MVIYRYMQINILFLFCLSLMKLSFFKGTFFLETLYVLSCFLCESFLICTLLGLLSICIYPISRKLSHGFGVFLFSIMSLVYFVDFKVYSLYHFHLFTPEAFFLLNMIFAGGTEVFDFTLQTYGVLFVVCLIIFFAQWGMLRFAMWKKGNSNFYPRWIFPVCMVSFVITNFIYAYSFATYNAKITSLTKKAISYKPLTANRFLERLGIKSERKDSFEMKNFKSRSHKLALPLVEDLECKKGKKNIVVIAIECWRFDMLTKAITPSLYRFSQKKKASSFQRHFSGGNATRTGIFSLFYGLPANYWHYLVGEENPGPVLLQSTVSSNYTIKILASAKLTSPEFDRVIFSRITNARLKSRENTAVRRDEEITREAVSFIEDQGAKNPFFLFMFYDSSHSYSYPKDYPEVFSEKKESLNYLSLDGDKDPAPLLASYKTSLHYVDSLVNRVLISLEKKKLLDDTYVVITGDHGEEFNETKQNSWGHFGAFNRYQTQVPLIFYHPGKEKKKTYSHLTTHHDINATLMDEVFHCPSSASSYCHGENLFSTKKNPRAILGNYMKSVILDDEHIIEIGDFGGISIKDLEGRITQRNLDPSMIRWYTDEVGRFLR